MLILSWSGARRRKKTKKKARSEASRQKRKKILEQTSSTRFCLRFLSSSRFASAQYLRRQMAINARSEASRRRTYFLLHHLVPTWLQTIFPKGLKLLNPPRKSPESMSNIFLLLYVIRMINYFVDKRDFSRPAEERNNIGYPRRF